MNIINKTPWITEREINLLKEAAAQPFLLREYDSLDDILTRLDVDVVIEPGVVATEGAPIVKDILEYWERFAERLRMQLKENVFRDERYREAMRNIEVLNVDLKNGEGKHYKRGEYVAKEKVVRLYPEKMREINGGRWLDEMLVSTLAHETMHVYFSRRGTDQYPYVLYVEEPLAEFGMLLYLHETGSGYYGWAYDDVKGKKSCYRYGALLMDMHLKDAPGSFMRRYLMRYPSGRLYPYSMPEVTGGRVSLPRWHAPREPEFYDDGRMRTRWKDVYQNPPRYYYDEAESTLYLDGEWCKTRINEGGCIVIDGKTGLYGSEIKRLYLGPRFYTDDIDRVYPIRTCPVYVSPMNRTFAEVRNIPIYKKDNRPALRSCGKGLYDICRDGKWGVVDAGLNQVIPCKYDGIGTFGRHGLAGVSVRLGDGRFLYGVVDLQGVERVPLVYDSIRRTRGGAWILEKDGKEHTFDSKGNPTD